MYIARGGALDGAERQLCYLVQDLDPARFVPVVVLDAPGPLAEHLRSIGVETHIRSMRPWRSLRGTLMRYVDAWAIARLARQRGGALVHASDLWKSRYALFAGARLSVPTVIHVRCPIAARDVRKHGLAHAAGLIAIAQRYQEDLSHMGVRPPRVRLIDDAVDIARFHPAAPGRALFRQRYAVGQRVAVGLVGRVEAFKRILEFLEVVALTERRAPAQALYFVIGQDGPESYLRQVRAAVTRLGLSPRVLFTGRLDEMPQTLAGLDILTTLSGGSVMFEAMACSKAVLSVRQDARHSQHTRHDQTAWCVTTDQPEPAAEALLGLIADAGLRARLGRTGSAWVQEHLSRQALARKTQAFYDTLLGD
jgi:glycosyltransferase involved in cell wall biosynthesis